MSTCNLETTQLIPRVLLFPLPTLGSCRLFYAAYKQTSIPNLLSSDGKNFLQVNKLEQLVISIYTLSLPFDFHFYIKLIEKKWLTSFIHGCVTKYCNQK